MIPTITDSRGAKSKTLTLAWGKVKRGYQSTTDRIKTWWNK